MSRAELSLPSPAGRDAAAPGRRRLTVIPSPPACSSPSTSKKPRAASPAAPQAPSCGPAPHSPPRHPPPLFPHGQPRGAAVPLSPPRYRRSLARTLTHPRRGHPAPAPPLRELHGAARRTRPRRCGPARRAVLCKSGRGRRRCPAPREPPAQEPQRGRAARQVPALPGDPGPGARRAAACRCAGAGGRPWPRAAGEPRHSAIFSRVKCTGREKAEFLAIPRFGGLGAVRVNKHQGDKHRGTNYRPSLQVVVAPATHGNLWARFLAFLRKAQLVRRQPTFQQLYVSETSPAHRSYSMYSNSLGCMEYGNIYLRRE